MGKTEIKVSEERLAELLDEVEQELAKALRGEEQKLSKALPPGAEDESAVSAAPEASAASAPPPPAAEGSAEMPEASSAAPGEAPGEMPGEQSPHDDAAMPPHDEAAEQQGAAPDEQQLKAAYDELSDEELKTHYMALKAALFERMGGGDEQQAPEQSMEQPPESPSAPPALKSEVDGAAQDSHLTAVQPTKAGAGEDHLVPKQPTKAGAEDHLVAVQPKAEKAELNSEGNGGAVTQKHTAELNDLKKQLSQYDDALSRLTGAVKLILEQPVRKAVTDLADIRPTQKPAAELSKAEIHDRLNQKAQTVGLKKSDRAAINRYVLGMADETEIAHLIGAA